MGKKKPTPPPAPDYAAQAQAQALANQQAAQQSAALSNPNVYSPYGNQTVTYAPTGPGGAMVPTIRQSLTPEAQAALDAQQQVQMRQAQLANQGMTQAEQLMATPFQYQGPGIQTSLGYSPGAQTSLGNYGSAQTDLGDYGQVQNSVGGWGNVQTGIGGWGDIQTGIGGWGDIQSMLGDYGSAIGDLDLSQVAKLPVNAGQTGQQAIMSRLQPQIDQGNAAYRQMLANQGVTAGGEAFDNAMRVQNQGNNDLYQQAALAGLGLDFTANQQGFNQALQQGQFGNAAQQQNYAQMLGSGQFANAAQLQQYQEALGQGQFANAAQLQQYQEALGQGQFANEAQAQQYQEALAQGMFANSAQQQRYGQALGAGAFQQQGQQQNYNQALQAGQFYNQGLAQDFNQQRSAAEFGNNAAMQSLQQQLGLYNQPLNQIGALMSGSQIQTPQFQQYQGQNIAAAPLFDAAKAQGQYNQDLYGQQMAGYNAQMNALGQVVSAPFGMFKFG